jgi:hypothetical protein
MEPFLSDDSDTIITWCLDRSRPTRFYTERLGLPQTEISKGRPGSPTFEGNGKSRCKQLYDSVMKTVNRVADRYSTKEELSSAARRRFGLPIVETARPLLTQLGPVIWSASGPYMTIIRPLQYPQYLKFDKENDRQK